MDFGQTAKPAPIGNIALVARSEIVATRGSVSVQLPPEQTVQSAKAGDAVKVDVRPDQRPRDEAAQPQKRSDAAGEQQARDVIQRRLVIEPRTRSIVLQEKDAKTGETIQTIPDEATLKLRIFARELTERARDPAATTGRYVERTA